MNAAPADVLARRRVIILDSTPLGLLVRPPGTAATDACQEWYVRRSLNHARFYVPEIILYEVRRELLRLGKSSDLATLDYFVAAEDDRLMELRSPALRLAADLWAQVRCQGRPTAGADALDADVILAAQVLTAGWDVNDTVTATSNAKHVGLFVPAADWRAL